MTAGATMAALWQLARPRGMLLVLGLPAVGYGFGHWEGALANRDPTGFLAVLAAWWLLSAGTLWLNASLDRDKGEVLMATPGASVQVPDGIWAWGCAALVGAVGLGLLAGPVPAACVAICAALAVGYSHPRTAWKAHPVLGPIVNVLGYGLLSPVAGFVLVGVAPTLRTVVAEGLVLAWVAATYLGAQAFQEREDQIRGYRTLVATHGPAFTVRAARLLYGLAIGGLMLGGIVGWFPRLVVTVALPGWWLDRHLAAWAADPSRGASAGREMLRRGSLLAAWVLGAVIVEHLWRFGQGLPVAGLGTSWQPGR